MIDTKTKTRKRVNYRILDFLGFPGYRVGTDGSVWSRMNRKGRGTGLGSISVIRGPWRKLKLQSSGKYGHLMIILHSGRKIFKAYSIHRLVLLAFVGPCPDGMEGCHFPDRNTSNNDISNLRWATHKENESHKVIHGTNVGNRGNCCGELQGSSKLDNRKVLQIRELFATGEYTQGELANMFGVHQGCVSGIVSGKGWKRVGGPITKLGRGGNRKSRRNKIKGIHS